MNYDPATAQRTFRRFKTALTRAINSKDPHKVIAAVRAFEAHYKDAPEPIPDDWNRWQRALDDACYALQRRGQDFFNALGATAPTVRPWELFRN